MLDGDVGLDDVAGSDGQCLMVAETIAGCMTGLLSSLIVGFYYHFIPFMGI